MRTNSIPPLAARNLHRRAGAFAIAELILTVTTATIVIGTALTSLTIYVSITDDETVVASAGGAAAVLPAEKITMDALLFHLEFQKLTHEADLCYVIGGSRHLPGSEASADFVYTPALDSSSLHSLAPLDALAHAPDRALSSHVITQLLQDAYPSSFTASSVDLSPYQNKEFTVFTVESDKTVTSVTTQSVVPEEDWIIMESAIYRPSGNAWSKDMVYRCAIAKEQFDAKENLMSLGAKHYWVRHDRADPVAASEAENSLWNRYEEGFCRVEFPDNTWNIATHAEDTSLTSKFTYLLPVVK